MPSVEHYKREQAELEMFLAEIGDRLAREVEFVERESGFGGNTFIQTMVLGSLENGTNSRATTIFTKPWRSR
ncbi:MAG: hypothetical protein ACOYL5_12475 [Phototrophicaceae bacterium]|jgi:hypothetical protein